MPAPGTWLIVGSAEHGMALEWRSHASRDNPLGAPPITLVADQPLAAEQWRLIRQQFENMGIRARDVRDKA